MLKNFIMTDPSLLQFARKINGNTWQYCQVKDNTLEGKELIKKYERSPSAIFDDLNEDDLDNPKLFLNEIISFDDIDDDDIQDICDSYGLSHQSLTENEFIQLVIEGYFEQMFVIGSY